MKISGLDTFARNEELLTYGESGHFRYKNIFS